MTKQSELTLDDILTLLPAGDSDARELLRRAYALALEIHREQFRDSDEPCLQHPLSVAYLLAEMRFKPTLIAAGLLHAALKTKHQPPAALRQQLRATFDPAVLTLVEGMTKLEAIELRTSGDSERDRDEQELESLRKMFIAMAEDDLGVIFIKLADRLHNMRTLDGLDRTPEQQRLARETMQIFAPLANRVGTWAWKAELEDLAFRYLNRPIYDQLAQLLEVRREARAERVVRHIQQLETALREQSIAAQIKGRPKHIYSIHRKMLRKNIPFERVYDTDGLRIIVNTEHECYQTLGIVHGLWTPIPGEFDDYIAKPKPNGYQSLHTAIISADGKTFEIQIRTTEMDEFAENGVAAAHWRYKEGHAAVDEKSHEIVAQMRKSLQELTQNAQDAQALLDDMQADMFEDRIYAFTPQGKVIELPLGATPIDFAYHVHTDIGHRCRGARVNGRWSRLNYQLRTGEQVEIITSRTAKPNRNWLDEELGYTKTNRARQKIRQWFRQQSREENITRGRLLIEQELKRLGLKVALEEVTELFRKHYQRAEDFFAAVGMGDIGSERIVNRIEEHLRQQAKELAELPTVEEQEPDTTPELKVPVHIQGAGELYTRVARCCNPLPGEEVIGYVTRGRGVTIHRRDCPNVLWLERDERDRLIELEWGVQKETFPVQVRITAYDRSRLLHDISTVMANEDVNMVKVSTGKRDRYNIVPIFIIMEIPNLAKLRRVLDKIGQIPNVIAAERYIKI